MIEMEVASIRMGLMSTQRVVILKEKNGERHLPIWIGISEAESIMIGVQGGDMPRPLTHDMTLSIIKCLGGQVNMAIISNLRNDCFYSDLILTVDNKKVAIDCRPSDAISIAVRANVPIFAEEEVLNAAGIILKEGSS